MIKINFENYKEPGISKEILMQLQKNIEEAINQSGSYSLDEIATGREWINGKEIYRKTFNIPNLAMNFYTINLADLNIEQGFVDLSKSSLFCTNIAGQVVNRNVPLMMTNVSTGVVSNAVANNQCDCYFNSNFTSFIIEVGSNVTATSAIVTIEYTKKA